ncbi:hypothetical protein [Roseococcus sp.]|uniref:hypothetical protein n=1 Tax=Roseococcus sp. TaxID=2109646 RepID=UPI003BA98398
MRTKIRFVINSNGSLRQLLSAEEQKDGTLSIYIRHAQDYDQDGIVKKIKSQKYSIHPNPQSNEPSRTIKHTLLFSDGTYTDTCQFRYVTNGRFLAHIYSRCAPTLNPNHYDVRLGAKSEIIRHIFDEDIRGMMMFHHIIVSDPGMSFKFLHNLSLQITHQDFSNFRLGIISGFFTVPAFEKGHLLHSMTSEARTDKNAPSKPVDFIDLSSLSPQILSAHITINTIHLQNIMWQRLQEKFSKENFPVDLVESSKKMIQIIRRNPLPKTDS